MKRVKDWPKPRLIPKEPKYKINGEAITPLVFNFDMRHMTIIQRVKEGDILQYGGKSYEVLYVIGCVSNMLFKYYEVFFGEKDAKRNVLETSFYFVTDEKVKVKV